jgi:mannose-6-phosphate isomerase-like protein (cupin superfamily)
METADCVVHSGGRLKTLHKRGHRPWGYYDSIDMGARSQVKRIVFFPGGILSLQNRHHRFQHWIVVHNTAEVTIGNTVREGHAWRRRR